MLKPLPSESARRLHDFFVEAGFTQEQLRDHLKLHELPSAPKNLPYFLDRTRELSLLDVLIRWFRLGVPLQGQFISGLVPHLIVMLLLESGMLIRDGAALAPTVMLTPYAGYLFVADLASRLESEQASDLVLWPNPTSRLLHLFTNRSPSQATLDLGTGSGMQAILAAPHSQKVSATDLNARAAEFVAFNSSLNGVHNIEILTGDTFQPVEGCRFDLIVANLPFYVTPSSMRLYCENNLDLDDYCRRVVCEGPNYLEEGGYLQMTLEWVQVRGQAWQHRLAEWLQNTGCDAWVLRGYARDAAAYAQERIGKVMSSSGEAAAARFEEWMAYYRSRNVEEVHGGLLAMRRRSGKNWVRVEEMPVNPCEPFGDSVLETFANYDALASHREDWQLLALKPRLAADAQLDQGFHRAGGKWVLDAMKVVRTKGLPASLAVDSQVAEFLGRCDGSRTLRQLAAELASAAHADLSQVEPQCCAVVRKLLERRLVLS